MSPDDLYDYGMWLKNAEKRIDEKVREEDRKLIKAKNVSVRRQAKYGFMLLRWSPR